MPAQKRGARYTPEEAEAMIPIVAKRVALEAIDLVIAIEKYPYTSGNIERRVWSFTGQAGLLNRLFYVLWKYDALSKAAAQKKNRD